MNTTAAALQAHVTTATIRTWCRIGAIDAIKQAGRWIIDTASLAARIAIGRMRGRKATMSHEPLETRVSNSVTIRATHEISPAYGTGTWYAAEYTNGYRTGGSYDGATAQAAIDKAVRAHEANRAQDAALAALEDAGIAADLATGYTPGMHGQLDTLTAQPRRLAPGQCATCGLNARTCDCR